MRPTAAHCLVLVLVLVPCATTASCQEAPPEVDRVAELEERLARVEERLGAVERTAAMTLPAAKDQSVDAVLLSIAERRDPRELPEDQKLAFFVVSGWNPADFELLRLHVDLEQIYRAQALAILSRDGKANPTFGELLETQVGPKLQIASDRLSRIRAMIETENWTRSAELVREPVE